MTLISSLLHNAQLVLGSNNSVPPSFNTENVSSSGYETVVPLWGYSVSSQGVGNDFVDYPTTVGSSVTNGQVKVTRMEQTDGDKYYRYDVTIPRWSDGSIRLLSVEFCAEAKAASIADLRCFVVNGSTAIRIGKMHGFSYATNASSDPTNKYATYANVLPIKSGIDIRFTTSSQLRHIEILWFH